MSTSRFLHIDDNLRIDLDRQRRTGIPEVVYAEGKSDEDLVKAVRGFIEANGSVFVSRLNPAHCVLLSSTFPDMNVSPHCGIASQGSAVLPHGGIVSLVSAGTSDRRVVDEAGSFLEYMGVETRKYCDVGVAALGRLLHCRDDIDSADVVIVCAGMEAALPSVLAGLCIKPVIGVPTSVGYGVSMEGRTALYAMLSACSPGLTVVNIDNGIGAAAAAARILLARAAPSQSSI